MVLAVEYRLTGDLSSPYNLFEIYGADRREVIGADTVKQVRKRLARAIYGSTRRRFLKRIEILQVDVLR